MTALWQGGPAGSTAGRLLWGGVAQCRVGPLGRKGGTTMRQFGPMLLLVAVAGAAAVVVYAQLTDTQTASGTITVSSTAADLYICEPNATPGPDCGSARS